MRGTHGRTVKQDASKGIISDRTCTAPGNLHVPGVLPGAARSLGLCPRASRSWTVRQCALAYSPTVNTVMPWALAAEARAGGFTAELQEFTGLLWPSLEMYNTFLAAGSAMTDAL